MVIELKPHEVTDFRNLYLLIVSFNVCGIFAKSLNIFYMLGYIQYQ